MPVWFVTGKLGAGKTLVAVSRMKEYLGRGRPVATNIDLNLDYLLKPTNKTARVIRIPDKPTSTDLELIGVADEGAYDESKFGLLVLDELGSWLNSRDWNSKDRRAFINWCIHARKLRWDIIFLVQNIDMVDARVRNALCEYLVVTRRTDRIKYLGVNLPKMHVGKVYYGSTENPKLIEDRWFYKGTELYDAYDTSQGFSEFYEHGSFSILPPGYHYQPTDDGEMKKEHALLLAGGSAIAAAAMGAFLGVAVVSAISPEAQAELDQEKTETRPQEGHPESVFPVLLADSMGTTEYQGFIEIGKTKNHLIKTSKYGPVDSRFVESLGGTVRQLSSCAVSIQWPDNSMTISICKEITEEKQRFFKGLENDEKPEA